MGVPVRPSKPTGGGGGTSWIAGVDLLANELEADIVELYNVLSGNLDVTNFKALAGILGTMLADAPAGVPTSKINDKAVTDAKLAYDGASDALRAVGVDHVKTDAIAARALELNIYSHASGVGPITPGNSSVIDTGLSSTGTIVPLLAYLDVPGVGGLAGLTIYKDNGSNTWKISVYNISNGVGVPTLTLLANELKMLYVD